MDTSRLNLNLIRKLNALLNAKNVTIASKLIGVSQSSMSTSLKQLRQLFNDELLVPGQYKIMQLTPLGISLLDRTRELVNQIDSVFNVNELFNPETSQRIFRIGMTDLIAMNLLQPLMNKIEVLAPNIHIKIVHPKYLTATDVFESNQLDILVGSFENIPTNLKSQLLFTDELRVVSCIKHPISKKTELNLDDFLKYPLIQFALDDVPYQNNLDKYFDYNKAVLVSISQAITPLLSLSGTNYLMITLKSVADKIKDKVGLKSYSTLFLNDPFICKQYWHPKDDKDHAHRWLRCLLKEIAANVGIY